MDRGHLAAVFLVGPLALLGANALQLLDSCSVRFVGGQSPPLEGLTERELR